MNVMGANFLPGAIVDLGNPHVVLTSVTRISCNQMQLIATVDPTGPSLRAAQIGLLDLTVSNPDSVFGMKSQAFEVLINPARFDINQSDPSTTNRIDGKDTVSNACGFCNLFPEVPVEDVSTSVHRLR